MARTAARRSDLLVINRALGRERPPRQLGASARDDEQLEIVVRSARLVLMRIIMASLLAALLHLLVGCGTTDEDRIDVMIKDVTGELSRARVEHALAQYVDLSQQSLSVSVFGGDTRVYLAEDAPAFAAEAERRLSPLHGKSVSVLRRKVHITGGEALVDLQLFGREGMVNVHYELVKRRPERWLISDFSLTR